jgi:hypothetical protein
MGETGNEGQDCEMYVSNEVESAKEDPQKESIANGKANCSMFDNILANLEI